MRIIIIPVILLTVCWGMLTGCYKDKGNYQYHGLNNITTNLSDTAISVFQLDTLRIHPEVKQSIPDKEGLEYEWVMYPDILTSLTRRTLSTTRNLDALIVEGPGMKNAGVFRISKLLPHVYYDSNNKIYLYNIPAASAGVTYSFPAATVIRSMKTSDDDDQLIVATYENTEGKVYYFDISATGDFEGNSYSKISEGLA